MKRFLYPLGATLLSLVVIGMAIAMAGRSVAQEAADTEISITLANAEGQEVGSATFREGDDGVTISVALIDGALEPGEHGIHIHETGECDPSGDEPFSSAGEHFNPTGAAHGGPPNGENEAHAGDLGNLTADENGAAEFEITTDRVTLASGEENSLSDDDGSALVIHTNLDDLETDPSGESGGRLICGVIFEAGGGAAGTPGAAGSPAADGTPDDGAAMQDEVTVEMVDIAFNPNELTIPANTDVTVHLPNLGAAIHNFHIDELDVHSEDVAPGAETAVTINAEPGEYEYYCSVPGHRQAGMVGTLIVE